MKMFQACQTTLLTRYTIKKNTNVTNYLLKNDTKTRNRLKQFYLVANIFKKKSIETNK